MKKHLFSISLLLLLCTLVGTAQVNVYFSEDLTQAALTEKNLTPEQQTAIQATFKQKLADYSKNAKLINPSTGIIDRESVAKFKELFTLDARVYNDLREFPEANLYPLDGYIELARSYFPVDGLAFGLNSGTITAVEYSELERRYTLTVMVSKTIEKYYKADGTTENGGPTYDLEFIYTFKIEELDNARIMFIRGKQGKVPDVYTNMYSLGVGMGFGQLNFSETDFFSKAKNSGTLSINAGTELSLGVNLYTNFFNAKKSPNKRLFLAAGLTAFYQEITGTLENYETSAIDNEIKGEAIIAGADATYENSFSRTALNVNVEEVQKITGLRIPLGLGFRIFSKNTSAAFLNLQYAPSFVLATSSDLAGTGDYAIEGAIGGDLDFNFSSTENDAYSGNGLPNAFGLGNDEPIVTKPTLSTSLIHGLMFSGLFFKDLLDDDPTYGLAFGVQYYMPLTDMWSFNSDAENPFLYPNRDAYIKPGVLSPFAENAKLGHIGISLSVYYKKNRKP